MADYSIGRGPNRQMLAVQPSSTTATHAAMCVRNGDTAGWLSCACKLLVTSWSSESVLTVTGNMKSRLGAERAALVGEPIQMIWITKKSCNSQHLFAVWVVRYCRKLHPQRKKSLILHILFYIGTNKCRTQGFSKYVKVKKNSHKKYCVSNTMVIRPRAGIHCISSGIAMMPLPQLWAVCFFITIILLGLDTQVSVEKSKK